MQTPKTRAGSLEVPQRTSSVTSRTIKKTPGSDSDSVSSPNPASRSRTPKVRSPKVVERKSPRSPVSEKKCPDKVSELESQLAQLQEELKKSKDQLSSSELHSNGAQQEAKKQLAAMSAKLEESQRQLMELSASQEDRVEELRKISQQRDQTWQSELEAVQKDHSKDTVALASAKNEIQKLKIQLERVAESETAQTKHAEVVHAEIQNFRLELTETLSLVEKLKAQLSDCKESEAWAIEVVDKTQMQVEMAKSSEETLRPEGRKAMEGYKSLAVELDQSKALVHILKDHVTKLTADLGNNIGNNSADASCNVEIACENGEHGDIDQLKAELNRLKFEVGQLRSALDASEKRYQEECMQITLQIQSAYELEELTKSESTLREDELESMLKVAKAEIADLMENLLAKESNLHGISEENDRLNEKFMNNHSFEGESKMEMVLKKFDGDLTNLKACLLDKETELQSIAEENEMLKMEIKKRVMESNQTKDEALALAETARAAEREALVKLGYLTEEADKSSRKAARVNEQLDAAQAATSEMEAELTKLKVQSDQWRKAAEAAAAMLSTGNNSRSVERTRSVDYQGSPFSDIDDESRKKKNGNMLKKIGVLLKKGQK